MGAVKAGIRDEDCYAIICRARSGEGLGISTLALVDRSVTRKAWWTSDDAALVMRFVSKAAAEDSSKRLKFNSPRVVPYLVAVEAVNEQGREIAHNEAMCDPSWDAHKGFF